ncbi:MAG: DbpA RNA binding domain-containing protein [Gemmatimonadetes bacterium]|nr:DbpA RNA binding domain-containing protein [Gemmatimonadota bacterium]MBK9692994.1 DbpA RNA binding domain-containing protein [Gemmatimonadota bacterium]
MSGLTELSLAPAVAGALESFGCTADDPAVRDQVPPAARGTNLALAWPPAARYAAPALAGLVSALTQSDRQALILVPPHALDEWAAVLLPLVQAAGLPAAVTQEPARATRRLREGRLRLLLTTPETALALLTRSALKAETLGHVVLAWPELYPADEPLAALMQDVPAEAQRIVVLARAAASHPVLERYARRALLLGPLSGATTTERAAPVDVRMAVAGWAQRGSTLSRLLEAEDPARVTVWCADARSAAQASADLPVADASLVVTTGMPEPGSLIVAWDLPAPARLAELRALGEVVLLVPPHAVGYVTQVTAKAGRVRFAGPADQAREAAARRREATEAEIARGDLEGELLALAPLFERHDPALVAAALARLLRDRPVPTDAAPARDGAPASAAGKAQVWIGVGKKDGAGPGDVVAALARDAGVQADKIGRIELRELFCLVEVPAADAEGIARAISGKTIRRRQVVAKVDQGRPAPSGDSRGPSKPIRRGKPAPRKP